MRFKIWLNIQETLAGPGGGPDFTPIDLVALNRSIATRGAGAFQTTGENPPKSMPTATHGYEDPRFYRRAMKKNMRDK